MLPNASIACFVIILCLVFVLFQVDANLIIFSLNLYDFNIAEH